MKTPPKKLKRTVRRSLVHRLRTTCHRADQSGAPDDYALTNHTVWMVAEKLDAIGEALAFLVERKKLKRDTRRS